MKKDINAIFEIMQSVAHELERGCKLYCKWYDTNSPALSSDAMAYELVSFMRQALHKMKDGQSILECHKK